MTTLVEDLQAGVAPLFDDFGEEATFDRVISVHDFVNDTTVDSDAESYTVYGIWRDLKEDEKRSYPGARGIFDIPAATLAFTPEPGDKFVNNGASYRVIDVLRGHAAAITHGLVAERLGDAD